jgi:hypothetical protein
MNRIETLNDLRSASLARRSIIIPGCQNKPIPAAVAMNWSGTHLWNMFWRGMYIYEPKVRASDDT